MIIYKSTNIVNGNIYIGLTTKILNNRLIKHKSLAFNSKQTIHKAIRKLCRDERKSTCGFKWIYKKDYLQSLGVEYSEV
jgi:predicted GIY-YIG superfamily endonuclease